MIILIFIGLIILTVGFMVIDKEFALLPALGILVCFLVIIGLIVEVSKAKVIDDKIDMYIEENTKIEKQIDDAISNYMEHENVIFNNAKSDSSIVLVSLYPELKSDKLIKSQIEIYTANNEKIKELKTEKINKSVLKWWLYFGK